MSSNAPVAEPSGGVDPAMNPQWNWHPVLPIPNSPLFELPPRPVAIFRWFAKSWLRLSMTLLVLGSATLTWIFLQPALERSVTFEFGWIAQILLRNLGLTVVVAGSLHLYFHTFRKQGGHHRFMKPGTARKHRKFTCGDQVLDNMFWTLASGVPIWSVYEVLYLWAYTNGYLPALDWAGDPALLALLFLLTPLWLSFHFYWIHRLLHWRPLYRMAHSLHHRNIDTGPWTGISMHPLEHLLYFSSILIHPRSAFKSPAHAVPYAGPGPQSARLAFGLFRSSGPGREPARTGRVSSPVAPSLFQLQFRHGGCALGQMVWFLPRRNTRGNQGHAHETTGPKCRSRTMSTSVSTAV